MVTGDNLDTAIAISKEAGIKEIESLTGKFIFDQEIYPISIK